MVMSNEAKADYPITTIQNYNLQLSLYSLEQSPSLKIAIWKDKRLEFLDIPKGLIELLQIHGFTIEMILESGPSKIAEILGIDEYLAQIIFSETNKQQQQKIMIQQQ